MCRAGRQITQQYVKNAFLTQERTFSRKFREIFIAVKLDRKYSKNQILEWYLNTIYLAAAHTALEAAAETYFGKPVQKTNGCRGCRARLQHPITRSVRPGESPGKCQGALAVRDRRHGENGEADPNAGRGAALPKGQGDRNGTLNQFTGPNVTSAQVKRSCGPRLRRSTLNGTASRSSPHRSDRAARRRTGPSPQTFKGQPKSLRQSLVAVDPGTGKVLAYYGGSSEAGFDYAQAWRQTGLDLPSRMCWPRR